MTLIPILRKKVCYAVMVVMVVVMAVVVVGKKLGVVEAQREVEGVAATNSRMKTLFFKMRGVL